MRSNSLDEEQLDVKIHEICQEWAAMGITHKTLQDAKRHVYNTLNVKRAAGELANAKRWNTVLYDMMRPYLESCGYDKETAKAFGEHYNVVMPDGRRLFVALENFERDIVPRMVEFKNRLGNENRDTG